MIAILLATYNSEKYIKEQLDSIISQTYQNWVMYVHDDGSTDNTTVIIDSYMVQYPNKICYISNQATGLHACKSFIALQEEVDADYYMFCDHDDVWLPNKIEISYERLKKIEQCSPKLPIVVHTDMKVVDENLNIINQSFWRYMRLLPEHCSLAELAACHCVNGCTIIFNRKANEIALKYKEFALMHDVLLSEAVVANKGIISFIHEPTVLYRQHGDNVLGAQEFSHFKILRNIFKISNLLESNYRLWFHANRIGKLSLIKYIYVKIKLSIIRMYEFK